MVFLSSLFLLWLASRLTLTGQLFCGLLFAQLLLTSYQLIHEACHDLLHPERRINDAIGMVLGWLFPVSFTLMKVTHIVHHCCNRSDHEMFDCYYPGDNRALKLVQWYGLLTGLWWWLVPLGSLLLAIHPAWLRSPPFRKARTTAVLFDDFGMKEIRRVRLETLLGILFWLAAFHLLNLQWQAVLLLYALFGFNWATRQYVTHAFSPRDVVNGAWNLKVGRLHGLILLNGQWDRLHHQHPHVSWVYLPVLARDMDYDKTYWWQYFRLWRGPRPCQERGPACLPRMEYRSLI
jgi:fatty acid desaturase